MERAPDQTGLSPDRNERFRPGESAALEQQLMGLLAKENDERMLEESVIVKTRSGGAYLLVRGSFPRHPEATSVHDILTVFPMEVPQETVEGSEGAIVRWYHVGLGADGIFRNRQLPELFWPDKSVLSPEPLNRNRKLQMSVWEEERLGLNNLPLTGDQLLAYRQNLNPGNVIKRWPAVRYDEA